MKSLVLTPDLPDRPDTGGRIRTRVLLRALARLGEVEVAAPVAAAERAERLASELGIAVAALPAAADRTSVARKLAAWGRGRSEVLGRRWAAAAAGEVRRLLAARAPDVLVADASHVLPLVPRAPAVPLLLQLHNVESALLARADAVARPVAERLARAVEARLIARLEGRFARRARLVVAVSELDRRRLLALCSTARVEVVENSVDIAGLPLQPPPAPSPSPLLLLVGTFDYPPNVEAAAELLRDHLPVLRARWPAVRVRLVGSDRAGAVAELARRHGAEVTGRVADLLPHYREATAVYLPIRSGGGTRLKVMEAFALGRPVLATEVAVEGLGVEAGVHYLRVETPQQGVGAVAEVLAGRVAGLLQAARALAEQRFGHDAAIERLAALVGGAFGAGGGPAGPCLP